MSETWLSTSSKGSPRKRLHDVRCSALCFTLQGKSSSSVGTVRSIGGGARKASRNSGVLVVCVVPPSK